ncbi:MAG: hypothetical protein R6X32_03190 [Chloroflexota bacterium]
MSCPHCTDDLLEELTADQPGMSEAAAASELSVPPPNSLPTPVKQRQHYLVVGLMIFAFGMLIGYLVRGPVISVTGAPYAEDPAVVLPSGNEDSLIHLVDQVNPPEGYTLPVIFGDAGPQMISAGAIDYDQFTRVYDQAGQPLTAVQQAILTQGSGDYVHINQDNAYFLLNFFWALGLVNDNPLLTSGPLVQNSDGRIERYAATGGWTIGQKPPAELYASTAILHLSHEQQERLEEVAYNVYRPCCDNHTAFADCNHGMALLGLLQLMAAQDATVEEMFDAAKYVNAFWFPQQSLQIATFFQLAQDLSFADVEARLLVGSQISSASGYRNVQQWLAATDGLEPAPGAGSSCGV